MLCVLVDGTLSLEKLAAWMGAESALYKFSEREAAKTKLQHHLVLRRPDNEFHPAYSACPDSEEWVGSDGEHSRPDLPPLMCNSSLRNMCVRKPWPRLLFT